MPRNARGRRKSKNHGLSEASKKKLDAIGAEAQEETLDGLLADFEIQSNRLRDFHLGVRNLQYHFILQLRHS